MENTNRFVKFLEIHHRRLKPFLKPKTKDILLSLVNEYSIISHTLFKHIFIYLVLSKILVNFTSPKEILNYLSTSSNYANLVVKLAFYSQEDIIFALYLYIKRYFKTDYIGELSLDTEFYFKFLVILSDFNKIRKLKFALQVGSTFNRQFFGAENLIIDTLKIDQNSKNISKIFDSKAFNFKISTIVIQSSPKSANQLKSIRDFYFSNKNSLKALKIRSSHYFNENIDFSDVLDINSGSTEELSIYLVEGNIERTFKVFSRSFPLKKFSFEVDNSLLEKAETDKQYSTSMSLLLTAINRVKILKCSAGFLFYATKFIELPELLELNIQLNSEFLKILKESVDPSTVLSLFSSLESLTVYLKADNKEEDSKFSSFLFNKLNNLKKIKLKTPSEFFEESVETLLQQPNLSSISINYLIKPHNDHLITVFRYLSSIASVRKVEKIDILVKDSPFSVTLKNSKIEFFDFTLETSNLLKILVSKDKTIQEAKLKLKQFVDFVRELDSKFEFKILSACLLNEKVGIDECYKFRDFVGKHSELTMLELREMEENRYFINIALDKVKNLTNLRVLKFSECTISEKYLKQICKSIELSCLYHISFNNMRVGDNLLSYFAKNASQLQNLTILEFFSLLPVKKGLVSLSLICEECKGLFEISFSRASIVNKGEFNHIIMKNKFLSLKAI